MRNLKAGVLLNSGLGNQLFMIFALLSYCIDNLYDYVLYYDNTKMKCYWENILCKLKDNISISPSSLTPIYEEPHFHYSLIPEAAYNINLKGYFQSDKYFKHNYKRIKELLAIDEQSKNIANEYSAYFTKKTIALHFRIGDYIGLQGYHCIKRPEYYIGAFEKMTKKLQENGENISDYNILYFCQEQDNHIVDQYLHVFHKKFQNIHFVKVADNIPDWKQLLLMSSCNHFIIANSTFSWFGAYLSKSYEANEAIVCYPKTWFGPLYTHNTQDLCPSDWISINDTDFQ